MRFIKNLFYFLVCVVLLTACSAQISEVKKAFLEMDDAPAEMQQVFRAFSIEEIFNPSDKSKIGYILFDKKTWSELKIDSGRREAVQVRSRITNNKETKFVVQNQILQPIFFNLDPKHPISPADISSEEIKKQMLTKTPKEMALLTQFVLDKEDPEVAHMIKMDFEIIGSNGKTYTLHLNRSFWGVLFASFFLLPGNEH